MLWSSRCRSWAWEDTFLWHEALQHVSQCFCCGSSFKTSSLGRSREQGLTILALCFLSKPQLTEFQTPQRKEMLTTNDTVCRMVQADGCGSPVPPLCLNFVTMGALTAESTEARITYRTFRKAAAPGMVAYTHDCSIQEAGTGGLWHMSLRNKNIVSLTALAFSYAQS